MCVLGKGDSFTTCDGDRFGTDIELLNGVSLEEVFVGNDLLLLHGANGLCDMLCCLAEEIGVENELDSALLPSDSCFNAPAPSISSVI
jgi:hypothetical protein